MNALASSGQLRASLIRWALFTVPTVLLLGLLSGQIAGSTSGDPWFAALDKPALYPPSATFGIVWTVLYIAMGFALALVCSAWGAPLRTWAIIAFVAQFLLNLSWSPVFFGAHQITYALAIVALLGLGVLVTTVLFWKVRTFAGVLMLPYLAWVLFATVLNWQFLQLNPDADGARANGAVERIEF